MPAWLTVYCALPIRHVTGKDVLLSLDFDDPHTFAEGYGIEDEDEVDDALANLRVERWEGHPGFEIRYRKQSARPILLEFWTDPERVAEERAEARETLSGAKGKGPTRIRRHLEKTVEIAALELGWSQIDDMGIVLAVQVAETLARVGDGVLCDQNDNWWAIREDKPPLLLHEAAH